MAWQYRPPFGGAVGVAFQGPAYVPPFGAAVGVAFAPPGTAPVAGDIRFDAFRDLPLAVPAPGVLAHSFDPGGQPLTAYLVLPPTHGTVALQPDGSFVYIPDPGFIGPDAFSFRARAEGGLDSAPAVASITVALQPTVRYHHTAAALPWGLTAPRVAAVAFGWQHAAQHGIAAHLPWRPAPAVATSLGLDWLRAERVRLSTTLAWAHAPQRTAAPVVLPWRRPPRQQAAAALPWGMPPRHTAGAVLPWGHPPTRQRLTTLPWRLPPARRVAALIPYTHPPTRPRRWWLPWRKAPAVQWHIREGAVQPPAPDAPPPRYVPPFGAAVGLDFVCPQVHLPGMMIPLRFGAAACYAAYPRPRVYTVLNTASVTAVATGQAIAVEAIDIQSSQDDMHHAFALALADPSDLQWLTPTTEGPIEVQINVNGHAWTGIVEEWTREHAFPGETVRVAGRSPSALLDAPYMPARAHVETDERSAHQLADHEVSTTGFDVDWGTVDWLIPGGTYHYDASTPAAQLRTLAEAAGAVARCHPWQRTITVRPRWPVSPWEWAASAPDKTILDDYVPRLAARNATSRAPVYEMQIPLWPGSAGDKPGLLKPGQLVEFQALAGWKAQATAVRISASMEDGGNGARALVVWQHVTLEAPPAAPRFDYVLVSGEQVGVSDPIQRDGTAGTSRLPQIVDPLITTHPVALERGRNAIAGATDGPAEGPWRALTGLLPAGRTIKGNVTALNADGSATIATSDGATIRARPLPEQEWHPGDGVLVQDGRIIDRAPSLPGITQYV